MAPIDSPLCVTRARSKQALSPTRPPSAGGPLAGCRILVVHDSPDVTSALSDIFTAAGARGVVAAHDGPEANVLLAWGGYHLVLLDATAPGAEDVLGLIQESMPNLLARTVVLTADLRNGHMMARLQSSYPTALFHGSWLVDLVGIAARAIKSTARRAVA